MIVIILIKIICSNKNARVFLLKLQKLTISKSKKTKILVELTGIEPATPSVQGRCSPS
jgi:hypothetical protein